MLSTERQNYKMHPLQAILIICFLFAARHHRNEEVAKDILDRIATKRLRAATGASSSAISIAPG
jgi:hypothetical protein